VSNETAHPPKIRLGLPPSVARWIPSRPWIDVEVSDTPWIKLGGRRAPLELHPVAPSTPDEQLAELARAIATKAARSVGVVVSPRLRASARAVLEQLGAAYADSRGHLHLPTPQFLIHLEIETKPSTVRARAPGVGPNAVRMVQALLQADGPLVLSGLAAQVELSLSQTHTVLTHLEETGLLRATGTGPNRRRAVADRTALLDWLVSQPSATRRESYLDVALYARRPEELWRTLTKVLEAAKVAHAVTGAAGAALYGAAPTAVPLSWVRITPDVPLERAARFLGAEPTDRGPNVRLLHDIGRVGSVGAERRDDVLVAPPVRVYLDALREKRGEAIAEHFREVILGY